MPKRNRSDYYDEDTAIRRSTPKTKFSRVDYTIGWIAALPIEMAAAKAMLDDIHEILPNRPTDRNTYIFGAIESHNIVITCLPEYGTISAAVVASYMRSSFPSLRYYLMVGIGGGVPNPNKTVDIRLGDIVVSKPTGTFPGVVQYDYGKTLAGGCFERVGTLNKPAPDLLAAALQVHQDRISNLISDIKRRDPKNSIKFAHPGREQDQLFQAEYDHNGENTCDNCDLDRRVVRSSRANNEPVVHYGLIGSGNQVMKDGITRDKVAQQCGGIYCFEMEAAGLMDAFPSIVVRGICDYSDSHKNKHWQGYAAATAAAYAKLLVYALPPTEILETENTEGFKNTKLACLQSLSFPNIDARRHNIAKAHRDTCDWFFQKPKFLQWKSRIGIEDHNGVLWIKGKPGAGKSTLMKHTFIYCQKSFPVHSIAAYFFHARGSYLEKSSLGMLRSLLYQILDQDPLCYHEFVPRFLDKRRKHGGSWEWHPDELKDALREIVRHQRGPIILLVDALDECEEPEVRSVVRFLEGLSLDATASGRMFNICLSSRHYPTIMMRKVLELVVEAQTEHSQDITSYVREELATSNPDIVTELLQKAQGVFMWVVLVTQMLNQAYEEGMLTAMRQKLYDIPNDLDEVFRTLLEKDNPYKRQTILMLQWVLFSASPLTPEELYHAVRAGTEIDKLGSRNHSEETDQMISWFITTISRGLVEIYKSDILEFMGHGKFCVQFIHKTVNDFLTRNNRLQKLDSTLELDVIGASHERLAHCCLSYLAMLGSAFKEMPDTLNKDQLENYPFLQYASSKISYHTKYLGYNNGSTLLLYLQQPEILQRVKIAHGACNKWEGFKFDIGASLLYISVVWGCLGLVQMLLFEPSVNVDVPGGYFGQVLHQATGGNEAVIQKRLRKGVDPNIRGEFFGNPLQAAACFGNRDIIKLLLAAGADVNAQGGHYGNALQAAVYKGEKHIIKLLLAAGADVNAQGGRYGNALETAISERKKDLVELLLAAGADVNAQCGRYGNALQAAAHRGEHKMIELLLAAGADINVEGPNRSSLAEVIMNGKTREFRGLLAAGVYVNTESGYYRDPINGLLENTVHRRLMKRKAFEVIELMLEAGIADAAEAKQKLIQIFG